MQTEPQGARLTALRLTMLTDPMPTTDSTKIEILPYTTGREVEIVALLNRCLEEKRVGKRDAAYWKWKHEANPFGRSLLLLAAQDQQLVGLRAFMRWELECDGEWIQAAKPVDSATHPDFQRRGIFSRLTRAAIDQARESGVQLLFNTPNTNSLPGYLKLGWRQVDELPLYASIQRPCHLVTALGAARLGHTGETPPLDSYFREPAAPAADVFESRDALESLLAASAPWPGLATRRSFAFLQWRYAGHPHIQYFAETVRSAGRLEGVLFYRTNCRGGVREIMINEICLRGEDASTGKQLLNQLKRRIRADYIAARFPPGTCQHAILRSCAFWRIPRRRITLVANSLSDDTHPPLALTLGDIEGL